MGEGRAHLASISFSISLVEGWLWQHAADGCERAVPGAHALDRVSGPGCGESAHGRKAAGGAQQLPTGLRNSQGMSNMHFILHGRDTKALAVSLLLFCLS